MGTGTNLPVSVPSVICHVAGSSVQLTWLSVAGKIYRVACKNTLSDPSWTYPTGNITATGASSAWIDATAVGSSQRFYRIDQMN
jgi:hypothetical protein